MDATVESPCRQICQLTPDRRFCMGCGRTLADIAHWSHLNEDARRAANREATRRLASLGITHGR